MSDDNRKVAAATHAVLVAMEWSQGNLTAPSHIVKAEEVARAVIASLRPTRKG
jgi:hypothetical protein